MEVTSFEIKFEELAKYDFLHGLKEEDVVGFQFHVHGTKGVVLKPIDTTCSIVFNNLPTHYFYCEISLVGKERSGMSGNVILRNADNQGYTLTTLDVSNIWEKGTEFLGFGIDAETNESFYTLDGSIKDIWRRDNNPEELISISPQIILTECDQNEIFIRLHIPNRCLWKKEHDSNDDEEENAKKNNKKPDLKFPFTKFVDDSRYLRNGVLYTAAPRHLEISRIIFCAPKFDTVKKGERANIQITNGTQVDDSSDLHYIEVKIWKCNRSNPVIGVGLAKKGYYRGMVGWRDHSIGLHADDGTVFISYGADFIEDRSEIGRKSSRGDVIGVCWDKKSGNILFSKNGRFIAEEVFHRDTSEHCSLLLPTVTLRYNRGIVFEVLTGKNCMLRKSDILFVFRPHHDDEQYEKLEKNRGTIDEVTNMKKNNEELLKIRKLVFKSSQLRKMNAIRSKKMFDVEWDDLGKSGVEDFNNFEFVLYAVTNNGHNLEYTNDELKKDETIVLAAVASRGTSLQFADEKLRNSWDVVKVAVESDPSSLQFASPELRKDKKVAMYSVRFHPRNALMYLDDTLKRDRETVLEAIKGNGNSLRFADEELRKDRYIVLKSLHSSKGRSLRHAHSSLLEDREFLIDAMVSEPLTVSSLLQRNDRGIFLEAISRNEKVLEQLWNRKRKIVDRSFVLNSIVRNPKALHFAPSLYQNDMKFLLDTVEGNPEVLEQLDNFVRNQREFILNAVKRNGLCYGYITESSLLKDEIIAIESIRQNPKAVEFIKYEDFESNVHSKIIKTAIDGFTTLVQKSLFNIFVSDVTGREISLCRDYLSETTKLCRKLGLFKKALECAYVSIHLSTYKKRKKEEKKKKIQELENDLELISDIFEKVLSEHFFRLFSMQWKDCGVEELLSMKTISEENILELRETTMERKFGKMVKKVSENYFSLNFDLEEFSIFSNKNDLGISFDMQTKEMILSKYTKLKLRYQSSFGLFIETNKFPNNDEEEEGEEEEEEKEEEVICFFGCKDNSVRTGFGIEFVKKQVSKGLTKLLKISIKKKKKKKRQIFVPLFRGEFSCGLRNGHGIEYFPTTGKMKFDGTFKNGLRNGRGTEFHENGKKAFEGSYRDGHRFGMGKEYEEKYGKLMFRGDYSNGVRNGKGMEYVMPSSPKKESIIVFEGTFEHGKRSGRGEKFDIKSGIVTKGYWKNGVLLETKEKTKFSLPIISFYDIQDLLTNVNQIGQGGFGVVYRVSMEKILKSLVDKPRTREEIVNNIRSLETSKSSSSMTSLNLPKEVAVKIMKVESRFGKDILFCKVKRGISLCCKLKSENIHGIYAFIKGHREVGYISELCSTSVDKLLVPLRKHYIYLKDVEEDKLLEEEEEEENNEQQQQPKKKKKTKLIDLENMETKIRILEETSLGMKKLHGMHAMHRDLKWSNVLISKNGTARITDFDTLKEDNTDWRFESQDIGCGVTSGVGTKWFLSPEVYQGNEHSLKCDVYAYGLMMYCMIFMTNFPYESQYQCNCGKKMDRIVNSNSLDWHVANCNLRPLLSKDLEKVPEFLIDLMAQCWNRIPLFRPTFSDICYRFELEKKKSFVSVLLHLVIKRDFRKKRRRGRNYNNYDNNKNNLKSVWICDQKICILKPYKVSDIKNWVEEKFEGSTVMSISHAIFGKIDSDKRLEEVVQKEASPSFSGTSSSRIVALKVELDKVDESIQDFKNINTFKNTRTEGLKQSSGSSTSFIQESYSGGGSDGSNVVSMEKYEEAVERIKKLEKRNLELEKEVLKITWLQEENHRLEKLNRKNRKTILGMKDDDSDEEGSSDDEYSD